MLPPLPDELFEPLASRIAEVSGIRVPASKRWLLAARVHDRMRARSERDVRSYVSFVLGVGGEGELGDLVEALRVGETQFFRHQGQLRAIRRVALPEIQARHERDRTRRIRIWSAGCASGEEAYTLAMMLEDALPRAEGWVHEVLATDMSEPALVTAREGRYPAASIHGVPVHIAQWAFERAGEEVRVTERARAAVRFEAMNLLTDPYPRAFDLVLCRNVLIYFDRTTQRDVIERLAGSVVIGGYLALGYAERLDGSSQPLHPIRTEDGMLYRRMEEGSRVTVPMPEKERPGPARPSITEVEAQRPTAAPEPLVALKGDLEGDTGEAIARRIVAKVIASQRPVLDLRELAFADDRVGQVLARAARAVAAEGKVLVLVASAPGTLRFLRRHDIVPPAVARDAPPRGDAR